MEHWRRGVRHPLSVLHCGSHTPRHVHAGRIAENEPVARAASWRFREPITFRGLGKPSGTHGQVGRDVAGGTAGRRRRHPPSAFGKAATHRANKRSAPAACRSALLHCNSREPGWKLPTKQLCSLPPPKINCDRASGGDRMFAGFDGLCDARLLRRSATKCPVFCPHGSIVLAPSLCRQFPRNASVPNAGPRIEFRARRSATPAIPILQIAVSRFFCCRRGLAPRDLFRQVGTASVGHRPKRFIARNRREVFVEVPLLLRFPAAS